MSGYFGRKRTHSIHRSVLGWQIFAMLTSGLVGLFSAYFLAQHSFSELRHLELTKIADAVARHQIEQEDNNSNDQPGEFLSQVWDSERLLIYSSHEPVAPFPSKLGYQDIWLNGDLWRGYSDQYQGQTVLVAQEDHSGDSVPLEVTLPALALLATCSLMLTLFLAIRVRRLLQPLMELQTILENKSPTSLSPIQIDHPPSELRPLVQTVNALLNKIKDFSEQQKQFTNDAAHELRTPITAVGLFAQLARKALQENQAAYLAQEIGKIEASCHRASALIDQLLTLAQLEPNEHGTVEPVDLTQLLRDSVVDVCALADEKGVDAGIQELAEIQVLGNRHEFGVLVNNLLVNAVRYSPPGGRVDVRLSRETSGICLTVEDNGPGIAEQELERVFDRFHRVAGADIPGSGLGLSIVRRIAERHGIVVTLANRVPHGLVATVRWPLDVQQTQAPRT